MGLSVAQSSEKCCHFLNSFCKLYTVFSAVQSGLVIRHPYFNCQCSLIFKYTCRHRALNPLLVSRCVRCAVEQRCWRISRNAILQGGKSWATWGQWEGNVRTVKHFILLEAESERSYVSWEQGRGQTGRRLTLNTAKIQKGINENMSF